MTSINKLGKTGVIISVIGLGCMGMSDAYGASDEQENIKVLNRAIDIGIIVCTFWDTSDFYGSGANEILLSKFLKNFAFSLGPNGEISILGKPEYVRQACEYSLKRLGVDYIDLYYQIRVDPNTPIEDTVGALAELVKEGKIKYIGLSECFAETLRRAYKVHPIVAIQAIILIRFCENFNKNLEIVHKFNEFASKEGITTGQLRFALGDDLVTIPGTKKMKYLEENFEAGNIHLSPVEILEIRKIIDFIEIFGGRNNEQLLKEISTIEEMIE
ncbi:NADP-dependent oxidoreductase domain-containing protein [Rhizophagus diaphanus]|nr:NADP-dependent oxidoreductase domain-containing protein [Rhizophagus diaphanus] [Rhizophagus sp. MUCL 43196]